jgi:hypothetical protein
VTRVRGVFAALAIVLSASGVHAQVVKPTAPEPGATPDPKKADPKKPDPKKTDPKKPDAKKPDPTDLGLDDDDDKGDDDKDASGDDEPKTATKSTTSPEATGDETPLPPPPAPRAEEQPGLFLEQPRPPSKVRHVEVGPDFGLWSRPAENDSASYSAGFGWGAHARIEILPVLGFSAYANDAKHSVTMADPAIDQPAIDILQIGARIEPTWRVMPTLRLWLGLGIAWARAEAPAPTMDGFQDSSLTDRTGVFLEYSCALGGTYDVIPNWLALSLSVSGGLMANQSGDMFDETQAITNTGGMSRLPGLPEMESSFSALLGVGMIL